MMSSIVREKRSIGMSVKFWHNPFMDWFEKKLLDFTAWFWERRKQTKPVEQVRIPPTLEDLASERVVAKKTPAKRIDTKKATTKKKTDWTAK